MNLSDVSQTAIYTLICRATQDENDKTDFKDSMSVRSLNNLIDAILEKDRKTILKWKKMIAGYGSGDARRVVWRVHTIDGIVNDYISKNPSCTVINIACGFDTRYWRIDNKNCRYIELDFPEVISQKKELLKEQLDYEMISCSVLDTTWIDKVTESGNSNFLIIAEGLFMYLPEDDAKGLLQEISRKFSHSQFVLDMIKRKYTKGFLQKLVVWQFKLFMGIDVPWVFGIQKPEDLESYGEGYKVIDVNGKTLYIITASINENA